jgi:fumarylacetoacetate (FAA) hydrolase
MKFATLKTKQRDGQLILVSKDLTKAIKVPNIANTLQQVLDDWKNKQEPLQTIYHKLNAGEGDWFPFNEQEVAAPLPRAYQWADGSAYLNHVQLVRKARGAAMPENFWHDPLMYQGGSDILLGPKDPIYLSDENWGCDFEGEVGVITDDVPQGASLEIAQQAIRLILLINDVSLRNLIPNELAKNFGFFQSKPASSFSPVAITPDELGDAWKEGKVHLPLHIHWNNQLFGCPHAGEDMQFSFPQLIAHAAKTRSLGAGSIIGSGTISNSNESVGSACIAEVRMKEIIREGSAKTSFMHWNDEIKMEMLDNNGQSLFGSIHQKVLPLK